MEGIYKREFYKGKLFMYFFRYKDILPDDLYISPLYKYPKDVHCLEELLMGDYMKPEYIGEKEIGYVIVGRYNKKNKEERI